MPLDFVQNSPAGQESASNGTMLITTQGFTSNVTANNMLAVTIYQVGTSPRSFNVLESGSNTGWTRITDYPTNGGPELWVRPLHPGGNVSVSVTHGLGSGDFHTHMMEFSGFTSGVNVDAFDTFGDLATSNTHPSSSLGITSNNEIIAIISAGSDSTLGTVDATGYTLATNVTARQLVAWRRFATGATSEQGIWTSSISRIGRSSITLLSNGGGIGGGGDGGADAASWVYYL